MEGKEKKLFIFLAILVAIVIGINMYTNSSKVKIRNYILSRGFVLEDDGTSYYKKISNNSISDYERDRDNNIKSNYDYLYFNQYNNRLSEVIYEYDDKYESSLDINYSFSTNKSDYIYRINYEETSFIIKGSYDEVTDELTCKKEVSYNIKLDDKDDFCENVTLYMRSFYKLKDEIFGESIKKYLQK